MAALLRLVAMLVSNVAQFFGMRFSLLARECETDVEPRPLPRTDSGLMEKQTAAAGSHNLPLAAIPILSNPKNPAALNPANSPGGCTRIRTPGGAPDSRLEVPRRTGTRTAIPPARRSMLALG
jgi:hypothetical protein